MPQAFRPTDPPPAAPPRANRRHQRVAQGAQQPRLHRRGGGGPRPPRGNHQRSRGSAADLPRRIAFPGGPVRLPARGRRRRRQHGAHPRAPVPAAPDGEPLHGLRFDVGAVLRRRRDRRRAVRPRGNGRPPGTRGDRGNLPRPRLGHRGRLVGDADCDSRRHCRTHGRSRHNRRRPGRPQGPHADRRSNGRPGFACGRRGARAGVSRAASPSRRPPSSRSASRR